MSSQLWELLIEVESTELDGTLTCTECFAIMELLIVGVELGVELERLEQLARNHLAHCPDCQEQFQERLGALEEMAN
jgi:hypothetical protein